MEQRGEDRARTLRIPAALRREIERQAERDYPNETCGLLFGRESAGDFIVEKLFPALNADRNDARHRYAIDRKTWDAAERGASADGFTILGVYHSHPDSPPIPSETDAEFAFPEWVYWIVSVRTGRAGESRAWARSADSLRWSELRIESN